MPDGWYDLQVCFGGVCNNNLSVVLPRAVYLKSTFGPDANPITSISPNQAAPGQTLDITIQSSLPLEQASSTLSVVLPGVTGNYSGPIINGQMRYDLAPSNVNAVTLTGPRSMVVNVTIPPQTPPGNYDYWVNTRGNLYYNRGGYRIGQPGGTSFVGRIHGKVYNDFCMCP